MWMNQRRLAHFFRGFESLSFSFCSSITIYRKSWIFCLKFPLSVWLQISLIWSSVHSSSTLIDSSSSKSVSLNLEPFSTVALIFSFRDFWIATRSLTYRWVVMLYICSSWIIFAICSFGWALNSEAPNCIESITYFEGVNDLELTFICC